MSVDLFDVDVDVYLLVVDFVVPFLLVDADLDGVDVANFDAIHDVSDSILDAHSNLDVDANLFVVDFHVVDPDVHHFLAFDAVEVVVFEPFDGYLL